MLEYSSANAIKAILNGLPQSIRRKIGPCVSAKELWDKLEKLYSNEKTAKASPAIIEDDSDGLNED